MKIKDLRLTNNDAVIQRLHQTEHIYYKRYRSYTINIQSSIINIQ